MRKEKNMSELPAATIRPRPLSSIPEWAALILTFLLPLKFAGIVGIPEIPMTYWHDPIGIFVGAWPLNLFPFFALVPLLLTLLFAFPRKERNGYSAGGNLFAVLWLFLALSSFCGMKNVSTWDYATSFLPYFAGIGCYALTLQLLLENNPAFGKKLCISLGISFLFVLHCALNQYFYGFQEMEKYLAKQEEITGQELPIAFRRRFAEQRVTADFAAGNVFASYLLLLFPLAMGLLWKWGGRITPPLLTRIVLLLPVSGLFLFLLYSTKSRGCFLALVAGIFFSCLVLPLGKKLTLTLYGGAAAALGGFATLIAFDRGPRSIIFRLDYYQGALRMMMDNLFWGAGWGEFFHDFHRLKLHENDESPHSPHNILLTMGSQSGVIALLIMLLLLLIPLAAAILLVRAEAKKRKEEKNTDQLILKWTLLAALGCWTIHALGEINLEVPGSLGCYMAVAFFTLHLAHKEGLKLPFTSPLEKRKGAISILIASLLLAAVCAGTILTISPKAVVGEIALDHLNNLCSAAYKDPNTGEPASMDEILQQLQITTKLLPHSPFPWDRASNAAALRGPQYAELAFSMLEEAKKRAPERSTYDYRKYMALRKLGRLKEAEISLQKARKLAPKNYNYYKYLPPDEMLEQLPGLW